MPTQVSYGGKTPDGSKIAGLKSKILRPALTSHFEVEIPVGAGNLKTLLEGVVGSGTDGQRTLNINCSDSSLPGSSIATFELQNDYTGVTERFAHRRMYDDRIDFTFYVDAEKYTPIRFFERWMRFVTGESGPRDDGSALELTDTRYHYRMNFPNDYRCEGLKIKKFERDFIIQKLKNNNWNMTLTSKLLNLDRVSLYRKIKSLNIILFSNLENNSPICLLNFVSSRSCKFFLPERCHLIFVRFIPTNNN